jgi:hypothetical protein
VVAVVTGYYQAIVTRNYQKAFGYLAPAATGPDGNRLTLGSFLQLARMLDGMGGPVTRFSISAVDRIASRPPSGARWLPGSWRWP